MKAIVRPSELQGDILVPASKSAMQRACAAALLTAGQSLILNPGISDDDQAALSVIRQLGAEVYMDDSGVKVKSQGLYTVRNAGSMLIDCGESGLSLRMFTPIAALSEEKMTMTGRGSLLRRPMSFFEQVLPQLGVSVETNASHIPLTVKGPLRPSDITVNGSESSQYITGLLMAYAAAADTDVMISVQGLTSKPYIELTLSIMQQFNMNLPESVRLESFKFAGRKANVSKEVTYTVESDWSSASFLLVAAALSGSLTLRGLNMFSTQADAAVIEALETAGAHLTCDEEDDIHIVRSSLTAFEFDATDSPDLFPPLVALAAFCEGTSQIHGVKRLAHKESDRGKSLVEEFSKIGVSVWIREDTMYIQGGHELTGRSVSSHHDHRIAMALAVAGLRCRGEMEILDAECVRKSYPGFWNDIRALGASVSLQDE